MRNSNAPCVSTLACTALLAGLTAMLTSPMCAAVADDQDDEIQAQKEEAKQRKERYTTWMRDFSKGSAVRVTMPGEDEDTEADLVGNPVFRFHTQEITNGGTLEIADDGTLWIWTVDSRPVAVQKLEVCNIGGRLWTICFGSVSEGLVTVNWPGERRYRAMQPGVKYRPIPGAEAPSDKALTRNAQLKALKSRFTGLLGRFIADEKGAVEVKPITTPLYQYADKDSKLPLGAIFSMVNDKAGALNPGLLLILEARPDGTGKWRWEYGIVRLGMGQQLVRLDGVEVWRSAAVTTINDQIHDNWTFYFIKREFE